MYGDNQQTFLKETDKSKVEFLCNMAKNQWEMDLNVQTVQTRNYIAERVNDGGQQKFDLGHNGETADYFQSQSLNQPLFPVALMWA